MRAVTISQRPRPMIRPLPLACLAALLLAATPPARAEDDCRFAPISRAHAIAIAASVGLVRVEEMACDDGEWDIEGRDVWGREMDVEISARTGRVLEIDHDD